MTDLDDSSDVPRITIQPYRGALIASIQVDLEDRVLRRFQSDLLDSVRSSDAPTAIIDLSGVDVMDREDFEGLRRIIEMVALMGTETILCGMQPGVAASLVYLDVPLEGLKTMLNLDATLAELDALQSRAEATSESELLEVAEETNGTGRDEIHDTQ